MHIVLEYLMKRVEKLGVVKAEQSNLLWLSTRRL